MTDSREHRVGREGGDWGTGIDRYMQAHACTFRHKTQRRHCQAQCTACLLVALSGCASACASAWCTCHCHCCCCSCTNYLRWRACTRPLFLYFAYGANSFHCLPHCLSLCLLHCLLSLERETKFIARAFVLPTSARRLNVAFARQFPPPQPLLCWTV